jgi:hypothetical protein
VNNPYSYDVTATVHLRMLSQEQLPQLENLYNAKFTQTKTGSFRLQMIEDRQDKQPPNRSYD